MVIGVRSSRSHTPIPSAEPAAIAAPRAVISGMDGHTATQQLYTTMTELQNLCCLCYKRELRLDNTILLCASPKFCLPIETFLSRWLPPYESECPGRMTSS